MNTEFMDSSGFMLPTHPDAFLDHPRQEPGRYKIECPRCKGHGGWNLSVNAYPLHSREDTPENRHRYRHFRAACDHCNGWGYVSEQTASKCSGHEWVRTETLGRCYHRQKCIHCGETWDIDSSG